MNIKDRISDYMSEIEQNQAELTAVEALRWLLIEMLGKRERQALRLIQEYPGIDNTVLAQQMGIQLNHAGNLTGRLRRWRLIKADLETDTNAVYAWRLAYRQYQPPPAGDMPQVGEVRSFQIGDQLVAFKVIKINGHWLRILSHPDSGVIIDANVTVDFWKGRSIAAELRAE